MSILNSLSQVSDFLVSKGFNASVSELPNGASAVFINFGNHVDDVQIISAREISESEAPITEHEVLFYANREQSAANDGTSKTHGNTNNQNAKKSVKADSWLQVRITREDKSRIVRSLKDGEKLSEFVLLACEKELKARI